MSKVEEVVYAYHTKLMKEKGIERESAPELEIRRRNGIDSMAFVSLILEVEEQLDIELDEELPQIRKCRNIGELIQAIEAVYQLTHND